ncbi:RmlC-like cupin domain-containing protein [Zopfochytrium polystomum]|nr:RmlC-like cupin domain-containing protein [Zopfochytrium polystomum]
MSSSSPLGFILKRGKISIPAPFETQNPFLFCVYHKDMYPPGNGNMEAPVRGNRSDFNPNAPFRMYHGDKIPGFPQHPHRGFETFTCTIDGIVDHTDSLGCAGRYGKGDAQWMTAGKGIVHGENFPLLDDKNSNPLRFFQIWVNLPRRSKMVDPAQIMHWAENIPRYTSPDGKVGITVWAGQCEGLKALAPNPNSWAADPANDLHVLHMTLKPGGAYTLPPSAPGSNRSLYVVEGPQSPEKISIAGEPVGLMSFVQTRPATKTEVAHKGTASDPALEVLVLQGKPIQEPVAQRGPFVMNTDEEISQAYYDYKKTQFGGWPWPVSAVVFPRERPRFLSVNGKTEYPPKSQP